MPPRQPRVRASIPKAFSGRNADALFLGALTHDAVVVRRAGVFEVHFCALAKVVEPVQHAFVFLRGDDLIGQTRGAAHGNQQKDMPRGSTIRSHSSNIFLKLLRLLRVTVVLIPRVAWLTRYSMPRSGSLKSAGDTTETVVAGGIWPINGDRAAVDARILDFLRCFGVISVPGEKAQGRPLLWA